MHCFGPLKSTLLIALVVGPAAHAADTPATAPVFDPNVPEGSYIQGNDSAVYFVQGGYKHLVKDAPAWMHMQSPSPFKLLDITEQEFKQIPLGPEIVIPLPDGIYIKGFGPAIYFVQSGQKHWIPDDESRKRMQHTDSPRFTPIDDAQLDKIPTGFDIPPISGDPMRQFEVFSDQWDPDATMVTRVNALVAALKGGDFHSRSRAENGLEALGKEGIVALLHLDRHILDPEQKARIDKLLAPYQPISADDARKLRSDPAFLLGCLFSDEMVVRKVALAQLQPMVKPKLTFDPAADASTRAIAILPLMHQLIDANVIPSKTTPQEPIEPIDVPRIAR
jgi:hypothetical protein